MAGFMAMVSVLVVVAIEMFFAARGAGHSHHVDFEQLRTSHTHGGGVADRRGRGSFTALRRLPDGADRSIPLAAQRSPFSDVPLTPQTPTAVLNKPLPSPPREEEDEDRYEDEDDLDLDELEHDDARPLTRTPDSDDDDDGPDDGHARKPAHRRNISWADHTPSPTDPHQQRLVLQCLMLEAGILFHSVFIGLALSVSVGSSFIVLLIAISFHQTFEGLALGSRIAGIPAFSTTSLKPWAMSLMYGVTTPIGQAIGLGVQGLYDPASELGLLMVGIMNAISAGLLLYAGLVQLLAEDFLTDKSYEELRGVRRLQACGAVVAGCMLMALVGVWA
jgi:zinc transporter ZupT